MIEGSIGITDMGWTIPCNCPEDDDSQWCDASLPIIRWYRRPNPSYFSGVISEREIIMYTQERGELLDLYVSALMQTSGKKRCSDPRQHRCIDEAVVLAYERDEENWRRSCASTWP